MNQLQQTLCDKVVLVHVCTYAAPFGIIPTELDDVYPISQNMIASPFDTETITYVAKQTSNYITKTGYDQVILLRDPKVWKGKILRACKNVCRKKQVPFSYLGERDPWDKNTTSYLLAAIQEAIMAL
jgi:predicted RNA-binding protein